MKPATTILEISKLLKISPSTVSRALKNHPDIAMATRQKVLELAKKLDYEPNLNAVGLRTLNSKELALIVPNLTGFFYDSFIAAVEEEVRKAGYSLLVLLSGDDPSVEVDNLKICKQRRVEGLLMCMSPHTTDYEPFLKLQRLDIPVVFFDKIPPLEQQNTVRVADEDAARIAADTIVQKKKQRVLALFADPNMSITQRRQRIFIEVFETQGMSTALHVRNVISAADAEAKTLEAFGQAERPDVIFCMSDEILTGTMKAIQRKEVRIPAQCGVIAISNGYFPGLYFPEITYVETSGYKLGKLAFERIMNFIKGDKQPVDLTVASALVEGQSL